MKKKNVVFFSLVLGIGNNVLADGSAETNVPQMTLFETVQKMACWPDGTVLNGNKVVDSESAIVAMPKINAWNWIRKVLDASWLPPQDAVMLFVKGEFADYDVARVTWEKNGHRIEVAQTALLFTMKFTPQAVMEPEREADRRYDSARQLCEKVFIQEGQLQILDDDGERIAVTIPYFSRKIAEVSFDKTMMEQDATQKILFGNPIKDQSTRFIRSARLREISNLDGLGGAIKVYWFQAVHWWHDGVSTGFYFTKTNGMGPLIPVFNSDSARNWFREPTGRHGRSGDIGGNHENKK